MAALESLRERLAELADLASLQMLAEWDQLVMMPSGGADGRAHQLAALERLTHRRATAEEIGGWLAQLEAGQLDELTGDLARIARRDWERARRIPAELAAERAHASAEGQQIWQAARAADDFAAFAPALQRNVELARACGTHLAAGEGEAYDALLADYDFGLTAARLRELFSSLADALSPIVAEASERARRAPPDVPVPAQRAAVAGVLKRLGVDGGSWRVDVSAHPFTTWTGRRDIRLTTRYDEAGIESLLSAIHEYGHGLYEHQVDPALERTSLGTGTSMSIHESQSKLWENHVARHPSFAQVMCAELAAGGFQIAPSDLHARITSVAASAIRVSADPVTYPLHIVLRFELEVALIAGDLSVGDLPDAWREGMRRLLGVEVGSDRMGCLQDVHWSAGSFGYFPSYALGCLIAAQMWEAIERDLGPQAHSLGRGEVGEIRDWLGDRVHRHGRRVDTLPLVERVTGGPLLPDAFLRYARGLAGAAESRA